ncbi:MAG: hypothetical protein WDM96_08040 [Lacunisphaera sp.]
MPSRHSVIPTKSGPGVWDIHSPRVPSVEENDAAHREGCARASA